MIYTGPVSFDLVIFDCDGVLVDSEAIANRVWVELLTAHGLTFTSEQFLRRSVGSTLTDLYEGLRQDHGWDRPAAFDAELDARLAQAFEDVPALPGVRELLWSLRQLKLPVCVASNSRADRLHLKLAAAGLSEFFAGRVFHPGLVARGKPAPDLFLHAAGSLGARPAACLVIEDSVLGVRAGVSAGMTVWGYIGGTHVLPDLEQALRAAGVRRISSSMAEIQLALSKAAS